MKITSVNNDIIRETAKLLQKKYREEKGLFLLEGEKCIKEAIESGLEIVRIFAAEGYREFADAVIVVDSVMSKISSTVTPPKVVAVAKKIKREWNHDYKKVVLLEDIKDAGNLGTIIRTSAAFGVDAIVLYGDTVDLYNPKCVRSSVGNLWKIPVFEYSEMSDLRVNFMGYERIATLPKSLNSKMLQEYVPANRLLVMFGSEAMGLSQDLKDFATQNITIEMDSIVESLNLSISAGIILYELFKN